MTVGAEARRSAPWAGLLLGLVLVWSGFVQPARSAGPIAAGTVPPTGVADARITSAGQVAVQPPVPPPAVAGTTIRTPLLLHVPALELNARIVPVDVQPEGRLQVPDDPAVLGWWRGGGVPGTGRGSVVLDGHIDTRAAGAGAFFHLADLRPGDPVFLDDTGRRRAYEVVAVRSYAKPDLPPETFDTEGEPRLVLISCGGSFDGASRRYSDNVVVYAVPRGP